MNQQSQQNVDGKASVMLKVVEMVTHQQERMVVNYMVRLIVISVVLKVVEMVTHQQWC